MERSPYVIRKKDWIGKRVDYDKFAGFQCVDLFKLYCHAVLGLRYTKTGNANELRDNKYNTFSRAWWRIEGMNDLKQWDVVFSIKWNYGHVWIIDTINVKDNWTITLWVLEQNGSWKNSWNWLWDNAIRVKEYKPDFFIWVWRCQQIIDNMEKEYPYIDAKMKAQWYEDDQTTIYKYSLQYKR